MLFAEYWLDIRDRADHLVLKFLSDPNDEYEFDLSDVNKDEFIDLDLSKRFDEFWSKRDEIWLLDGEILEVEDKRLLWGDNCLGLHFRERGQKFNVRLEYGDKVDIKDDGSVVMKERYNDMCSDVELRFYSKNLIRLKG